MLQDHEDRQEGRRQDVITPPHPPTNVPTNGSAEKHEELPKVARTSVETSATDHTRCSEVTMIWKETRTRRGLRLPSEPKKRKTDTDPPQRDIRWLGEPQGWRVNPNDTVRTCQNGIALCCAIFWPNVRHL